MSDNPITLYLASLPPWIVIPAIILFFVLVVVFGSAMEESYEKNLVTKAADELERRQREQPWRR